MPNEDVLKAGNYPVVLKQEGNMYSLHVEELYIVEHGENLSEAYERLQSRVARIISDQTQIGRADKLPKPNGGSTNNSVLDRDMRRFAFKLGLIALVGVIVMGAAAVSITYAVREPMRHAGIKLGRLAVSNLQQGLVEAANEEMTAERQQQLQIAVAELAPVLQPYMRELQPVFKDLCYRTQ